ncbi:MAG: acetyl-CoA carboxylase carboxyl transferase subunit beta, partial [Armatimonadetes bacterium]|nr:acetyl-CoA carboxylase carboxyl transferase subunit beta [Armatimonadota bacterium]
MSPRFFRRGRPDASDEIPADLWEDCPSCHQLLYTRDIELLKVCNHCGFHFRLSLEERLTATADAGTLEEWDADVAPVDPLGFPEYPAKLAKAQEETGRTEGLFAGRAAIEGEPAALGVMDLAFFGGSMGYVVGEKVARLLERAADERLATVVFCASGGARMQESLISLMQMAKTSGAAG